jgi:hypothetical protein
MEMWIPGDRLGTERVPVSTDKQQTFSMVTGEYISGREEKNGLVFIRNSSLVIRKSFAEEASDP